MKTCQHCGKEIKADAINGLCPECLMKVGLGSEVRPSATDETKASENTFAPPPNAPLSIEEVRKLFPQLEIIEQIGRGGMGVVYKARQPQLDRFVALKLLPTEIAKTPGFAERFAREARALARLSHPNIVAVHDSGNAGGHFYFIMEFVDGANLRQMILSKQIAPETALSIVPKVCEALQFAHDEGILHRDIKPENILIDKKGRVKIADFGLAKLTGADEVDHGLTNTGMSMGTPRYMAPEQFTDTKSVDHRADIYSLGVVFYEMLTGELPMGRFALPSQKVQVDVRIDEVVLRSLEREPAQRYQHVSEVKTGVENVTLHGGHGAMASPPSPPKRDGETPAREALSSIMPFVGVLIGLAFGLYYTRHSGTAFVGVLLGGIAALVVLSFALFRRRGEADGADDESTTETPGGANLHSVEKSRGLGLLAIIAGAIMVMGGFIYFSVAADRAIASGIMDFQRPDRAAVKSAALNSATLATVIFLAGVAGICCGLYLRRARGADKSAAFWNACIIATGGIAAAVLLFYGISAQMLHGTSRIDFLALPLVLFAVIAAVVQLIKSSAAGRPASADAIPELALAVLGCLSAAMPWDSFAITSGNPWDVVGSGWHTNEARVVSFIYLVLALVLLVTGGRKNRPAWRPVLLLLAGLASAFIAYLFAAHPVQHPTDFGWSPNGLKPIYHLQTGWFVSTAIALLTILVAALQLRNRTGEARTAEVPTLGNSGGATIQTPEPRLSVAALWGALLVPVWGMASGLAFVVLDATDHASRQNWASKLVEERPAWAILLAILVLLIVNLAPFITTILGGVAVRNIKRSDGRIYGLPLAAFSALFFPLLLLGLFTAYVTNLVAFGIVFNFHGPIPSSSDAPPPVGLGVINTSFAGLDILVALVVVFFAARSAWRRIAGPKVPTTGNSGGANFQSLETPKRGTNWVKVVLILLGVVILVPALIGVLIFMLFMFRVPQKNAVHSSGPVVTTMPAQTSNAFPHLGSVSNGIGAEFVVPAGQVATFEVVTRKNGTTVPFPKVCAYVLSASDRASTATVLFARDFVSKPGTETHVRPWRIDVETATGNSLVGGIAVPVSLDSSDASASFGLGRLEPDRETVRWIADTTDDKLPDNGVTGLRIRTQAHGVAGSQGSIATSTTDWQTGLKRHPLTTTAPIGNAMETGVEAAPHQP